MLKNLVASFAAVAAIGIGSAAMAESAMSGDAMKGSAMAAMPTMVCRAAAKGETASAKMASGDGIVCKKIDVTGMMKGPGMMASASAENAAWEKMVMKNLEIPLSSGADASLSH